MNELNKQTEQSDLASANSADIARRRMILASLGKGASVAAAVAVPMNTLAAVGALSVLPNGNRCTMSGNLSKPHSTDTALPRCEGASPSYYSDSTKWPTSLSLDPATSTIHDLFHNGSTDLLIDILMSSPLVEDAHWIAAYFNGAADSIAATTYNFPYTSAEVRVFYGATDPLRSSALLFFVTYMENYVGSTATPLRQQQGKTDPSREKKPSK